MGKIVVAAFLANTTICMLACADRGAMSGVVGGGFLIRTWMLLVNASANVASALLQLRSDWIPTSRRHEHSESRSLLLLHNPQHC